MSSALAVPASLAATTTAMHGAAGREWLQRLPSVVAAVADRWGLTLGAVIPADYSLVVTAETADGAPVVLKAAFPGRPGTVAERVVLRTAGGRGYPRLLAEDPADGLALIARVVPGTPLRALAATDDEAATAIAGRLMVAVALDVPAASDLPTVAQWGEAFARHRVAHGGAGPLPEALLARGEALYAELAASEEEPRLLHGDLHHDNVLQDTDGWVAIDPHGVVGEPAFEVGTLLRNPDGLAARPDLDRVLARRLDVLADVLGAERSRLAAWGAAGAVLSAVWHVEDSGAVPPGELTVAEALFRQV